MKTRMTRLSWSFWRMTGQTRGPDRRRCELVGPDRVVRVLGLLQHAHTPGQSTLMAGSRRLKGERGTRRGVVLLCTAMRSRTLTQRLRTREPTRSRWQSETLARSRLGAGGSSAGLRLAANRPCSGRARVTCTIGAPKKLMQSRCTTLHHDLKAPLGVQLTRETESDEKSLHRCACVVCSGLASASASCPVPHVALSLMNPVLTADRPRKIHSLTTLTTRDSRNGTRPLLFYLVCTSAP